VRQSYLKNAALLTVSDAGLRLAGMGLRIYLANALGGEGMGLYQLVLAVYSLFVTLATSGVSVASTRLMAEELTGSPARAKGMLLRLCGTAMALGGAAAAGAEVAVSVTGLAGPGGGTAEMPVGLVYVGCAVCGTVRVEEFHFQGSRGAIRKQAAEAALSLALKMVLFF